MAKSNGILATLRPIATVLLVCLGPCGVSASSDSRILSDSEWAEDIRAVATAIKDIHPRPFRDTDQVSFEAATRDLLDDLPELTDKEVIVRLAALVALIDDGHTRLAIPREHPQIGLEFGHTPTPEPAHPGLRFRQLPIAFEQFDDGIFVTSASADHAHLIGLRLGTIDGMPAAEAMEALQAITFAENDQLRRLMGADRLSLPEALHALGITESAKKLSLELIDSKGVTSTVSIHPLSQEEPRWVSAFSGKPLPLRLRNPNKKFWSEYVAEGDFVYMQMDEIADDTIPLAEFVVSTLDAAVSRNARLIIDVRSNFGGSGGLNRTLVTSILRNESLNHHDRTFVLIGRRTFSAAQMLVNELERYTRVTFVGEPTGSRPDHFGDPEKIRLQHSGLTLRVSRLHWSSYAAFDDRQSTFPDLPASWTAKDYFSGLDPALTLAHSVERLSFKDLLREAIARGDMQQIGRYTLGSKWSADTYDDDFSQVLVELGSEFEVSAQLEAAELAYRVGLYFFPEHGGLDAALERLTSRDESQP